MKKIIVKFVSFISIISLSALVFGCIKKKESCTDGIHNQGELAIDCGGPCSACATCVDGIQNQGENGVDCGGPCVGCITCSDGIKNGDEVSIDCGGSNCAACAIIYPPTGTYGTNVLYGTDTLHASGTGNSFKATIPTGSSLRLELSLISGAVWYYSQNNGWTISSFSNNKQTFEVLNPGTCDLNITTKPGSGMCMLLIKYFENGTVETRRKVLVLS